MSIGWSPIPVLTDVGFSAMLFRPVYIRAQPLKLELPKNVIVLPKKERVEEEPTPTKEPTPQPPPVVAAEPAVVDEEPLVEEETVKFDIPMLIHGQGFTTVHPKEATRDVLGGKVDYWLVDESGVTVFQKKHIFTVLKIGRPLKHVLQDYSCILGVDKKVKEKIYSTGLRSRLKRYEEEDDKILNSYEKQRFRTMTVVPITTFTSTSTTPETVLHVHVSQKKKKQSCLH